VPPTSHGRLLDEGLSCPIEDRNDASEPQGVAALQASRVAQDTAYPAFPRARQGCERISIDFAAWLDRYCWDSDGLREAAPSAPLGAAAKQQRGCRAEVFGVLSGRLPHPVELALQPVEDIEATEPEGGAGYGKLS
jgi:hypothetical protein